MHLVAMVLQIILREIISESDIGAKKINILYMYKKANGHFESM